MRQCPYCGYANYDGATECRKCEASFVPQQPVTVYEPPRFGPHRARVLRSRALAIFILGMMMKVYWGGLGPWPVIDNPTLAGLRSWLEPLLIYGGAVLYIVGHVLRFF